MGMGNSMNARTTTRYGIPLITLHWFMLVLIVAVYACIELRELYPKGSAIRDGLKTWHYLLGLTVFALVWLRLLARLAGRVPPIVPSPAQWQLRVAHTVEFAIYLFVIVMPVLGLLSVNADGKTISILGLALPPLIGENKGLAEQLEDVHGLIGNIGYALIGIHALAALIHHYVQRDNTLKRMWPSR
jgi:superoxide oxidase